MCFYYMLQLLDVREMATNKEVKVPAIKSGEVWHTWDQMLIFPYALRLAVCIEETLIRHQIAAITGLRTGLASNRRQAITWTNDEANNWRTNRSPGLCGLGITFHHWENSPFFITITIKARSSSQEFNKTACLGYIPNVALKISSHTANSIA